MLIRPATPADAGAIARVHVDSWRTTYRGLVPQAHLDGLSYEARERMWERVLADDPAGRHVVVVAAEEPVGVVGFASGGPWREDPAGSIAPGDDEGELHAIYLLAVHQGHGLGRRLVATVAEALERLGYRTMRVWVLAANPAARFYEHLGGVPAGSRSVEIGGTTLPERCYAWTDLAGLAVRLATQADPSGAREASA